MILRARAGESSGSGVQPPWSTPRNSMACTYGAIRVGTVFSGIATGYVLSSGFTQVLRRPLARSSTL